MHIGVANALLVFELGVVFCAALKVFVEFYCIYIVVVVILGNIAAADKVDYGVDAEPHEEAHDE